MTTSSSHPFSSTAKPLTVIVADDSPESRECLRRWLEEAGHRVTCVGSGNEAIQVIKHQPVDLVITEVIMPNGDGLEVILELKKWQPHSRVLAVSGGGRYLPVSDCLRVAKGLGAHDVLPKPLVRHDVLDVVRRNAVEVAEHVV